MEISKNLFFIYLLIKSKLKRIFKFKHESPKYFKFRALSLRYFELGKNSGHLRSSKLF